MLENQRILSLLRPIPPDSPKWPRIPSLVKWRPGGMATLLLVGLWSGLG